MSNNGEYAGFERRYMPSDGGVFDVYCFTAAGHRRQAPNPCRKFHISSDQASAVRLAHAVLPLLRDLDYYHKVVRFERLQQWFTNAFDEPMDDGQIGKFITVYTPNTRPAWDTMLGEVAQSLRHMKQGLHLKPHPNPIVQRTGNAQGHREWEIPNSGGMLFGGFETNPSR